MTHEEAWDRLPDLLDDRDDAALLGHLRACSTCQRQLFLLGRVDRALRDGLAAQRSTRRYLASAHVLGMTALAAVVAVTLVLILPGQTRGDKFMLRTDSGRVVAEAEMGAGDSHNISLALTARHLPVGRGHMFVLWAGDKGSSMQVGRFMADRTGNCRARFNLPESHHWRRFWVTPEDAGTVIAST